MVSVGLCFFFLVVVRVVNTAPLKCQDQPPQPGFSLFWSEATDPSHPGKRAASPRSKRVYSSVPPLHGHMSETEVRHHYRDTQEAQVLGRKTACVNVVSYIQC